MTTRRRALAIFRKASYSPNQHRTNDTAIMEETLDRLVVRGWSALRMDESEIEQRILRFDPDDHVSMPEAELYLNMCQGARAANALAALESSGACILNRPSSVLACHRHRLVPAMLAARIPFPATEIIDLTTTPDESLAASPLVQQATRSGEPVWIKRGDVHAERSEDVVMVRASDVARAIDAFRARGIGRISLQRHVSGPVIKFYATANRRFFQYYDSCAGPSGARPDVDEARLRDVAFAAAEAVGLSVFGGDAVVASPHEPILIDLNDWPSFAPFREVAADHIAAYALEQLETHPRQPIAPSAERSDHPRTSGVHPIPLSSLASDPA